jgi:glycosyltransferase involved in cell wall biosynthesis
MKPKLSILIASLGRRHRQLRDLLSELMPQVTPNIEVLVYPNNGELTIGEYRQTLLEAAHGDYICFVDDDDSLPPFYCEEIIKAIKQKPDYVGFKVQLTNNEIERPPAIHSLRFPGWFQDEHGYYRGVTHLNPIKRELALKGDFTQSLASGEDEGWARQVRPFVKTEVFIDKFMYFYRHDTSDSHFGSGKNAGAHPLKKVKYKQLRYVEKS